ncbi:hypothetical protein CLNEO_29150 [Anaerotignum neopropionicum]|uniref:Uncharacterized protein n=1 Tax=Anaerotignum neopropionicum TaxID=36847 RepID=A0A136WB15_9FIRM|nr:hypothetical protein [Anaerotignum neopropionicum]KXL51710.1 hypothetical protein CLNEO_29150 [Anaerotignum neopropionicum]
MKETNMTVVKLSAFVIVIVVAFIVFYQLSRESTHIIKSEEITIEAALKEMPIINISPEETAFMQNLRQNPDVEAALEREQITELSTEKGAELAAGILPDDIKISELSVINQSVVFSYFINDYQVFLEIFPDNKIRKTIGVFAKNGNVKTVYENLDNITFKKSKF